ncbi:unnamed protein product [Protopolystoma xenopodis]|uniref:Uncharacterized protein n=1 Tax=Protopolystoma xenopodis TaxID=117903 RepID=A0A3S5BQ71_9PLAT|nr:unnamed protein product [Protopolystoma xenopodis]
MCYGVGKRRLDLLPAKLEPMLTGTGLSDLLHYFRLRSPSTCQSAITGLYFRLEEDTLYAERDKTRKDLSN